MQSIIGLIAIIVALIAVVELTPVCLEDSRVTPDVGARGR